jgi:hypothetical protein
MSLSKIRIFGQPQGVKEGACLPFRVGLAKITVVKAYKNRTSRKDPVVELYHPIVISARCNGQNFKRRQKNSRFYTKCILF